MPNVRRKATGEDGEIIGNLLTSYYRLIVLSMLILIWQSLKRFYCLIVHERKQSEKKNFHNLFEMEKETNPSVVKDEKFGMRRGERDVEAFLSPRYQH